MSDNLILLLFGLVIAVAVGLVALLFVSARVVRSVREIRGDAEKREISPQPLQIKEAHDFAKESDCKERYNEVIQLLSESNNREDGKRGKIYDQIRTTETNLRGEMKEGFRNIEAQLSGINRALGRLEGHPNE